MPGWIRSVGKVVFIFFVLLVVAVVSGYVTVLLLVPPENIPVPEVVGKTLNDAIFILSRSKLSVKVAGKKFSEEIPENVVILQSPAPGVKVREGRTVEIMVSAGGKTAVVPDLNKMKLREAQVYLSQFGIGVKNVSYINC
ncbi:PASTA domain-containing protein, partial [Candidatus Aerophobetes bacterium]|nr:PASTA domain-containing protein [Candidatus Aerophobetes bacterium]